MPASSDILVVGASWVGDMVMSQTLFKLLKQHHPDAGIDVLAPAWSRPLLNAMPEVRTALALPFAHGELRILARRRLGAQLRERYQLAILIPNSWKSALLPWFAAIPERRGWLGEQRFGLLNDWRRLDKTAMPLLIQRFAALAFDADASLPMQLPDPALRVGDEQKQSALAASGLTLDRPLLALCPGAEFGPAKRWPERHYAEVAKKKIAEGWLVCLLGSARDRPVAQSIYQQLGNAQQGCRNLAGMTTLEQAMSLLALTNAVVTNDSGLMHIAAALQRPLVALYGSSSPAFTPPLAPAVEKLFIPVDCGPCFQRECPLGHLRCLEELAPERVLGGLARLAA